MIGHRALEALARPLLFRLNPERAHALAITVLRLLPLPKLQPDDPRLGIKALGLNFPNPIGLAAGFDKNGVIANPILRLGFGFTEIGTVTPLAQPGNPRPRLFRLTEDHAIVNRLGFCGEGHAAVHARLAREQRPGIIGINIGANKDSSDRVQDYVRGIKAFANVADYFTINISSPNTPGLRALQEKSALDDLLTRVLAARDEQAEKFGRKPVLLKIAPDLSLAGVDSLITCARARKIDGLIVSNTTVSRPSSLHDPAAGEAGGLSGRPLFELSTRMLAAAYLRAEKQFPLIGVGGIDSAATALAKIEAGATLVQLLTGFVFRGLALPIEIKSGLLQLFAQKSYAHVPDAVGVRAQDWASGKANVNELL